MVTGIAYSILQSTSIGKSSSPISRDLALISQVSPFILLTFCFVTDVKSLELVFRFGGEDLPLFYRISAVWSSRSGPLLLWAALMAIVTRIMSARAKGSPLEVRIMHTWVGFILLLSLLLGPFDETSSSSNRSDGHPPTSSLRILLFMHSNLERSHRRYHQKRLPDYHPQIATVLG